MHRHGELMRGAFTKKGHGSNDKSGPVLSAGEKLSGGRS